MVKKCLLGTNLRGIANSCIDISDGLIGDLGHICKQSKVGAQINIDLIPYEGEYEEALTWEMTTNYVLLFLQRKKNN